MHEYVSNNRAYKKFKDFKESLFNFFDNTIPNIIDVLISRVTDNFRVIGGVEIIGNGYIPITDDL